MLIPMDGGGFIEGDFVQSDGGGLQFIEGHDVPRDQQQPKEKMHYRNGREAKNGDKIVKLDFEKGRIVAFGVMHDATPGNDYCNGSIAPVINDTSACMCDCLHVDDVAAVLAEKELNKRPAGK